jgi:hypothetical protein
MEYCIKLNILTLTLKVIFIAYLFDKFALYLEKKGLIFYRKKKSSPTPVGSALENINALLSRSRCAELEMKQTETTFKQNMDASIHLSD